MREISLSEFVIPPPRVPALDDRVPINESPPLPPEIASNCACNHGLPEKSSMEGAARFSKEMQTLIEDNNRLANSLQLCCERQEYLLGSFLQQSVDDESTKIQINASTPHVVMASTDLQNDKHIDEFKHVAPLSVRTSFAFDLTNSRSSISKVSRGTNLQTEVGRLATTATTTSGRKRPTTATTQSTFHSRGRLKSLLETYQFETVIALVIFADSIFIGVEVEYFVNARSRETQPTLYIISHLFTFIFFWELVVRCLSRCGYDYFDEANVYWNLLDCMVVLCSVLETILELVHMQSSEGSNVKYLSNLRVIRILRIVRMARVFRIGRVLRLFRALRALVYSIAYTLRSLFWAMVLLGVIIYCFAIVFTQSAADYLIQAKHDANLLEDSGTHVGDVEKFWGSLFISMRTLFQSITGGVDWFQPLLVLDRVQVPWVSNALFGLFIAFTYFSVLNVVTGVFCSNAMESQSRDNDHMITTMLQNRRYYCQRVATLFHTIDADESGQISLAEFEEHFSDPKVQAYFASLDLSAHDALEFFKLLDTDDGGYLDIEEFVDGCLRMRGPARSVDVLRIMHEQRSLTKRLKRLAAGISRTGLSIPLSEALSPHQVDHQVSPRAEVPFLVPELS